MISHELKTYLAELCRHGDLRALSIQQPWCHRILYEGKNVENRSWSTKFRGWVLMHAGMGINKDLRAAVTASMPRGGIVGMMEITNCVSDFPGVWFEGPRGFVIGNAVPLPFIPCRGALSFFRPPEDSREAISNAIMGLR